uniref:Uncharacterized protein n=1 Tax=Solanum tuberosum TaxID=4113 RepID=M1A4V8_SOLTU
MYQRISVDDSEYLCLHHEKMQDKWLKSREEKKVKNPSSRTQQGSISSSPEIERFLRGIRHQMIKTKCYVCRMDPPWVTKARGRGSYTRGRGRSSSSKISGSSYGSSSSSPIIQRGGMSLVKLTSSSKETTSSIHLDDIPENNPLYAQLRAYLSQKQSDTFASVAKEEVDDIRSYEREESNSSIITHYEKSDTSMRSETSDDIADDAQEAQPCESAKPVTEDMLSKAEDLLRELKRKDKMTTID